MADKFRVTFTIPVTFADGEQPTGAKLNAVSAQTRNGMRLIERALGDLWNQSGDALSTGEPLQVSNLARNLGKQVSVNALLPKPDLEDAESILIAQPMATQIAATLIQLDYKPVGGDPSAIHAQLSAAPFNLTRRATMFSFTGNQDYFLDTEKGLLHIGGNWSTLAATGGGWPASEAYLYYEVLGENFPTDSSSASAYNVIPHPDMESAWRGLKFHRLGLNRYLMYLPPRRPLSTSVGKLPSATENSATPYLNELPRYWYVDAGEWESPVDISANADHMFVATAKRYRYKLPSWLADYVATGPAGGILPTGSIYLWDNNTNTIIEGITFKVPDVDSAYGGISSPRLPFVIQIEGTQLDNLIQANGYNSSIATDDPGNYISRFSIITIGEGLAEKTNSLGKGISERRSVNSFRARPSHSDLTGLQPIRKSGSDNFVNLPPAYRPGDDHVYLLSREGSIAGSQSTRDRYNNGMLGDLLMLSTEDDSTHRQNLTAASRRLFFGALTGPNLYGSPASGTTVHEAGTLGGSHTLRTEWPLRIGGALFFNSTNRGLAIDSGGRARFFANGNVQDSAIHAGSVVAFNGALPVSGNGANDETSANSFVGLYSSTFFGNPINSISFKGSTLGIGEADDNPSSVVIGGSSLFRLGNNRLHFGGSGDYSLDRNANDYEFNNNSSSAGIGLRTGTLKLSDRSIWFGSVAGDRLEYVNAQGRYEFWTATVGGEPFADIEAGTLFAQTVERKNATSAGPDSWISSYLGGQRRLISYNNPLPGVASTQGFVFYKNVSAGNNQAGYADLRCRTIHTDHPSARSTISGSLEVNGSSQDGRIVANNMVACPLVQPYEANQVSAVNNVQLGSQVGQNLRRYERFWGAYLDLGGSGSNYHLVSNATEQVHLRFNTEHADSVGIRLERLVNEDTRGAFIEFNANSGPKDTIGPLVWIGTHVGTILNTSYDTIKIKVNGSNRWIRAYYFNSP